MNLLIFLLIFMLSFQIQASEVWITTSELSTRAKLHRLTEKPSEVFKDVDLISLHEALLSHPVSTEQLKNILSFEEEAQTLAVNGRFDAALKKYDSLLSKLELLPNVAGLEKITLNVKIRKAELNDLLSESSGNLFWRDAHAWAPDASLSRDIFAPSLIEKFKMFSHTPKNQAVKVEAPEDSSVFIDGNRLKFSDGAWRATVEPGTHQVAVLTPGALWEVQKILLGHDSKVTQLKFEPKPAVTGSCDQPLFTGETFYWSSKLVALFNDGACERVFDGKRWYSVRGEALASTAQQSNTRLSDNESLPKKLEFQGFSRSSGESSENKSITKSPWFWIGAGVLAVGATLLVVQNQQQSETVITPTKR
jgi:hypothetical protein